LEFEGGAWDGRWTERKGEYRVKRFLQEGTTRKGLVARVPVVAGQRDLWGKEARGERGMPGEQKLCDQVVSRPYLVGKPVPNGSRRWETMLPGHGRLKGRTEVKTAEDKLLPQNVFPLWLLGNASGPGKDSPVLSVNVEEAVRSRGRGGERVGLSHS